MVRLFLHALRHVLLAAAAGPTLTIPLLDEITALTRRFWRANGPCDRIVDLSEIERVAIPNHLLSVVGRQPSQAPRNSLIWVASTAEVYGVCRMLSAYRESRGSMRAPEVVRSLDAACARLGIDAGDFAPLIDI